MVNSATAVDTAHGAQNNIYLSPIYSIDWMGFRICKQIEWNNHIGNDSDRYDHIILIPKKNTCHGDDDTEGAGGVDGDNNCNVGCNNDNYDDGDGCDDGG